MPKLSDLERFTEFLSKVNLGKYRKLYSQIKIVEMDLPKDIQAIELLYGVYWKERNFLTFEDFYKRYLKEKQKLIEAFRIKSTMCKDCFYRGLEARIYRTWAGLITQIHGGYVAESVFGDGSVEMSRELDSMGADIRVAYKGRFLNYQVKKMSNSGVVSNKPLPRKQNLPGKAIDIKYEVPTVLSNPKTISGVYRLGYQRFMADKRTTALENGFVIFTSETFLPERLSIDKLSKKSG